MRKALLLVSLACLFICLSSLPLQAQQDNNVYWVGGYEFTFLTHYENKHCDFYCFFTYGQRLTVTKAGEVITDISTYLDNSIRLAGIHLDYVPVENDRGFVVLCVSIWKRDGGFNIRVDRGKK